MAAPLRGPNTEILQSDWFRNNQIFPLFARSKQESENLIA